MLVWTGCFCHHDQTSRTSSETKRPLAVQASEAPSLFDEYSVVDTTALCTEEQDIVEHYSGVSYSRSYVVAGDKFYFILCSVSITHLHIYPPYAHCCVLNTQDNGVVSWMVFSLQSVASEEAVGTYWQIGKYCLYLAQNIHSASGDITSVCLWRNCPDQFCWFTTLVWRLCLWNIQVYANWQCHQSICHPFYIVKSLWNYSVLPLHSLFCLLVSVGTN